MELLRQTKSVLEQPRSDGTEATITSARVWSADKTVKDFLLQNEPAFRRLEEIRAKASTYLRRLGSNKK